LLLHPDSHKNYPGHSPKPTGARIFFELDGDKLYWMLEEMMMLMLESPVRMAVATIMQTVDQATFALGDYD